MDFRDTPEEARFRADARTWLEANVPQDRPSDEVAAGKAWQAQLYANGWAGVSWPTEYGGRGGTRLEEVVFNEEEARVAAPSRSMFTIALGMVGPTLMHHGTRPQKERFLRPMLAGEECWSQLFSEPEAGSDLAALRTTAAPDGDDWVVNGQKVWTSGAHYREWGLLLARTDPSAPKHRGLTCFVVDMHAPGIEVRPLRQMTGASHFNEVFLSDLRIAAGAVVGEVNDGWNVAVTTLMNERVSLGGASSAGGKTGDICRLIALARARNLADNGVVRQRIADAYARTEVVRFLGMRARTALSRGSRPGPEGSVAKLASGFLAQRIADLALDIMGPAGALSGADTAEGSYWQLRRLQAPSLRIAGGTDEVQRNILGERVLGLPREPRADADTPFRDLGRG
jgi:acyl-CoA dehydrogenase